MASFFPRCYSKTLHMPNSQNRSNGKSGIVQPKRRATKASKQQPDTEQAGMKRGASTEENRGSAGKSKGQGRGTDSGGRSSE